MLFLCVTGIKEYFICVWQEQRSVLSVYVRNKGVFYLCVTGIKKCFIYVCQE